jgi:two-component system CheB/CheR fusion protein
MRGAAPSLARVVDKLLLKELVPPTVLVHERGDVVHVHGRTGLFLEPAQGAQASANIFNMARPGLQISLSSAIRQAASADGEVVQRGVQVKSNGHVIAVDVRVQRLEEPEPLRGLYRVTFDQVRPISSGATVRSGPVADASSGRVASLERELQYTKESHQGTIEELETANEELKSTNEELQSTNEELQSANEELETSKEEMQSLNEELQTVNAELQGKVDELSRANNDMKNLLNSTDIATVFLDDQLRIKRYTEQAKTVIRLIPTDVGRPIGDLVSSLHYDRLVEDAREVLRTLVYKEIEIRGENDEWYFLRMMPYRTTENVIDGLVLTFVDVTKVKALQDEQGRLLEVLQGSPVSVFGQDLDHRITWACSSVFGRARKELLGKTDGEIFAPAEARRLADLKSRVLRTGTTQRYRLDLTLNEAPETFDFYVEPEHAPDGRITGFACVATNLTVSGDGESPKG